MAWTARLRLGRDYYVRVLGNDYSVDPGAIGRLVDLSCDLHRVQAHCAGQLVADHPRCWARAQTLTDPAHVHAAKVLRSAFQARATGSEPPAAAAPGAVVARRPLSDYDTLFGLSTSPTATRPARLSHQQPGLLLLGARPSATTSSLPPPSTVWSTTPTSSP